MIQPLMGDSLEPGTGDPVAVLGVGPFSQIDPGDTISVDFAIVGGTEILDLQEHARTAQRAFDRNYIVPVPPPSPRLKVVARHQALELYWDDSPESFRDPTSAIPFDFEGYRVYVGEERLDLHRVAEFDRDDFAQRHHGLQHRVRGGETRHRDRRPDLPLPVHDPKPARRLQVLRRRHRLRPRERRDLLARERNHPEQDARDSGARAGGEGRDRRRGRVPQSLPGRGALGPGPEGARSLPVVHEPSASAARFASTRSRATRCSSRTSTARPTPGRGRAASTTRAASSTSMPRRSRAAPWVGPDHAPRARPPRAGCTCTRSRTRPAASVRCGKFVVVKSDREEF